MTRWKLTIEYDGRPFSGWQVQDGQPTVQAAVERAITLFCQQHIRIHAAGRTDAGVHARGQVVHFDLDYGERALRGYDLAKALNAHLRPLPVAVIEAEEAAPDFHARFSALNKLYRYRILNRGAHPAMDEGFVWQVIKPLDETAMHKAAQILVGQHDFTTFRDTNCQAKSPVRTITRFDVTRSGDEIMLETEARSFLHHQMRNMAGTLSMVGQGKWSVTDVQSALDAKDRTKGGMTAPSCGLSLVRIDY